MRGAMVLLAASDSRVLHRLTVARRATVAA